MKTNSLFKLTGIMCCFMLMACSPVQSAEKSEDITDTEQVENNPTIPETVLPTGNFVINQDKNYYDIELDQANVDTTETYTKLQNSKSILDISDIQTKDFTITIKGYFLYNVSGKIFFNMHNYSEYEETCSPCNYLKITAVDHTLTAITSLQGYNYKGVLDSYMEDNFDTNLMEYDQILHMTIKGNYSYTIE